MRDGFSWREINENSNAEAYQTTVSLGNTITVVSYFNSRCIRIAFNSQFVNFDNSNSSELIKTIKESIIRQVTDKICNH